MTEAFDGSTQVGGAARRIVQDTDYNFLGAVTVATQPYFLDTGASTSDGAANSYGMSLTEYDELGRPLKQYVSDDKGSQSAVVFGARGTRTAALTTMAYSGMNTTVTDDLGKSRTEEKNIDGKVGRVTNELDAQIAYEYDAFGTLVKTKDPLQNEVSMVYDIRGRKKSMSDPDTGIWEYDYDALGQMVWQRSPNQAALAQETTMAYDLLGRMVTRTEPEYTSSWYFDQYADGTACNQGIGKLCATATSSGIKRKVVYDDLGRVVGSRTDVQNGPSMASSLSYNSDNGMLATQTYPTGLRLQYNYTARGFLASLSSGTEFGVYPLPATAGGSAKPAYWMPAGLVLWQGLSYNAWGKLEQQGYANGVSGQAAFDAATGRVAALTAGKDGGKAIVDYSYDWDSLNRLKTRTDANGDGSTGAVSDSFEYDELGRLKQYTVSAPSIPSLERTVTLQYNALGNVLLLSLIHI